MAVAIGAELLDNVDARFPSFSVKLSSSVLYETGLTAG